jgi:cobalt-zinc-cadmium resistance protein CzcA
MIDAFLRHVVQQRLLILICTIILAAVGGWSLLKLPIDAVPDVTNVQVQVNTEAAALAPLDIERQVSWPIETAMAGIPGLKETRSLSRNGFSQVTVIFVDGTDIFFARQQVAERLLQARESLPIGAEPAMGAITTGLGEVLMYTVAFRHPHGKGAEVADGKPGWQSDGSYLTPEGQRLANDVEVASYLRTVQAWIIAPQLRQVRDVAGVDSIGGYERQYLVAPDPYKLASYGLSMRHLIEVLEANNQSAGGRFIERFGESYVVRADGRVRSVDDIGNIVVANRGSTPIHVHEIATVGIGKELRSGSASRDGDESVVGTVQMLLGANSRTVASAANERLTAIGASLPPDIFAEPVLNRQNLVNATIATVQRNLMEGALLVTAVLFLMLGNLRGALIAALVIPLSMLLAAIGMVRYGVSGNLMSLGALDFGIIVDAAIIIVENCLRLLAERQHQLGRLLTLKERLHEVFTASREMVQPVLAGQAIIITVFIPIVLLTGIEGKMFAPMGLTVIFALIGSLILSFTFVPALVALICSGKVKEGDNWLVRIAKRGYAPSLAWALRWRWPVIGSAVTLFLGAAFIFTRLGSEFVPNLDEGDILLSAKRIPSTSITQATAMQLEVEKAIRAGVPEVKVIFSKNGTAEAAADPMPPNFSDTYLMLKPREEWPDPAATKEEVIAKAEKALAHLLGTSLEWTQPIQMRFNELVAGVRGDVAVKVFGDRYEDLIPTANAIAEVLSKTPGGVDVKVEQVEGLPAVSIEIKRDVIARLGLNIAEVQDLIATAVGGRDTGVLFEGDRRFPILVRLPEDLRNDPVKLKQLPVPLPEQATSEEGERPDQGLVLLRPGIPEPRFVPLGTIADLQFGEGLNQISRDNGKRRVVVQANVRGRDLGGFVADVQAAVAQQVKLPAGTWLSWGGTFQNLTEARERLVVIVPGALLLVFFLLFSTFNSVKYATLVFSGVPLALTGGVAALLITGIPFSISAAVGFIALSGVAVLNGLVVVGYINHLRKQGMPLDQAITEGSLTKLRPMLMTALVGALGYVPMALAHGQGAEVQKPLATVVIGGIISSALLTLYVLPALYRVWHRSDEPIDDNRDDPEHLTKVHPIIS